MISLVTNLVAMLVVLPCVAAMQDPTPASNEVALRWRQSFECGVTKLGHSLAVRARDRDDEPVMLAAGAELCRRPAVLVFDASLRKLSYSLELENDGASFGAALEWNGKSLCIGAPESRAGVGRVLVVANEASTTATELAAFDGARDFGRVVRASDEGDDPQQREVLIGAPLASDGEWKQCGAVAAYDAKTFALRWIAHGEKGGDEFGSAIEELDDLDGDGAPDFAIASAGSASFRERSSRGRVIIVSGATGRAIRELHAPSNHCEGFGSSLASIADRDGDGHRDLAIGAPSANSGEYMSGVVIIVSTRTGAPLDRVLPKSNFEPFHGKNVAFGWQVASIDCSSSPNGPTLIVSAPAGFYCGCDCGWWQFWPTRSERKDEPVADAPQRSCGRERSSSTPVWQAQTFELWTWDDWNFPPMRCGSVIARSHDRRARHEVVAIGTDDDDEGRVHVVTPECPSEGYWEFSGGSLK